jgi:hypothetical protein
LIRTARKYPPHALQTAPPIHQVSGGEIQIRVDPEQTFKSRTVGMYIGEDQ